jgi:type IX secretion system PorP/SprF family membrane protein
MKVLKIYRKISFLLKRNFLFFLLICSFPSLSQDVIYSQNSILPHFRNPAITGLYDAKFKLSTDIRSQYFTVSSGDKFNCLNFSFDSRFNVVKNDFINIGIVLNKESLGSSKILKNRGLINFSFAKQLSYDKFSIVSDFLIAGFQFGIGKFSYGMESYTFGIQFDKDLQQFNSEILSGEQFTNSKLISEFNIGLLWYRITEKNNYYCGISTYHINQPDVSFNSNITRKYLRRLSILYGSQHEISNNIALLPSFDFSLQGSNFNLRSGLHLKVGLDDSNYFKFGSVMSINRQIRGIGITDLILNTSYEFSDFGIGLSYEINLSSIKTITGLNGAFEVAGYYLFGKSPKRYRLICPTF